MLKKHAHHRSDKTGTITEGCMEVADMVVYDEAAEKEILEDIMCGLTANLDDTNATFMALKERCWAFTADKAMHRITISIKAFFVIILIFIGVQRYEKSPNSANFIFPAYRFYFSYL